MYLRASEMSKQAWSEAVKTNNLEEHMLLDPLYYSFGDKEQKCWGVQVNVGGVQNMLGGGGCTNEVGGGVIARGRIERVVYGEGGGVIARGRIESVFFNLLRGGYTGKRNIPHI